MKTSTKVAIFFGVIFAIIGIYYFLKWLWKRWLDYQNNKDRTYNVFDKAVLSNAEINNMKKWLFDIPKSIR
jgi:predicted membrane protein